jgi:hypothetical protein
MNVDKNPKISWFTRKYTSLKFHLQYYFEAFKPYGRLSLEFSKIFLGCLLFIFVPQLCEGPDTNLQKIILKYNLNITDNIQHVCTFQDNFYDINNYKIFVIFWNFLTLGIFLINFILEIIREKYIQSNFEYTITFPVSEIKDVMVRNEKTDIYDKIKKSYDRKTLYLYYSNYACLFMLVSNIIFTSVMIYKYYYNGFRSITGLFSVVILIFQKIYYNYDILKLSLRKNFIISTSLVKPHDYNTLEPIKFKCTQYIKKEHENKSYNLFYLENRDQFLLTTKEHVSIFPKKNDKNKKIKNVRNILINKINKDKINKDNIDTDEITLEYLIDLIDNQETEQLQENNNIEKFPLNESCTEIDEYHISEKEINNIRTMTIIDKMNVINDKNQSIDITPKVSFDDNICCRIYDNNNLNNQIQIIENSNKDTLDIIEHQTQKIAEPLKPILYLESPKSTLSMTSRLSSNSVYSNDSVDLSNSKREEIRKKILEGDYEQSKIVELIKKQQVNKLDSHTKLNNSIKKIKNKNIIERTKLDISTINEDYV